MNQTPQSDHLTLFCARCAAELTPGTGDFYVVQIEASADLTPPRFSEDDMERAHALGDANSGACLPPVAYRAAVAQCLCTVTAAEADSQAGTGK